MSEIGNAVLLPFLGVPGWNWKTRLGSMYATAFGAKLMINSIFFFLLILSIRTVDVHPHDCEPR